MDINDKKKQQLGMPLGTATGKLRKIIMFSLLVKLGENICFQCGEVIDSVDDLSIEHKIPYLDSDDPSKLFFDLDNIAFSHLSCNIGASRKLPQRSVCMKGHPLTDDNIYVYPNGNRGCRICRRKARKNFYKVHRY